MMNNLPQFPEEEQTSISMLVYNLRVRVRDNSDALDEVISFTSLDKLHAHVCNLANKYFSSIPIDGMEENIAYRAFKYFYAERNYPSAIEQMFRVINWDAGKHSKIGFRVAWDDSPSLVL